MMNKTESSKSTSRKTSKTKMPQQWSGCRCMCCGKLFNVRANNFSKSQSYWFHGNDGFIPWCKECMNAMFDYYQKKYGNDEEAMRRIAMFFDVFYADEAVEIAKNSPKGSSIVNMYMGRINMRQYSDKTYDHTIEEEKKEALSNGEAPEKSKVTLKMIKEWGKGLDEQDYLYLDEHYKELKSRQECKTIIQEILFKNIVKAQLSCDKAFATGDTKKIKEATDNLQNLMTSANIKPNQTNDNALSEANTFGTLIKKWETTRPISEPDPEWADVDGIGHYFRVWILSPILEMFNLKNPYQDEYNEEIEKYTAHKPQYQEDEDTSDSIRDKIFGDIKD